jgi:hypothetical protein
MGLQTSKPNNNMVLITLLIINLIPNLTLYVFFSFHFKLKNLCFAFKIQLQTFYANFLHLLFLVNSEGNLVTSIKFTIWVESNCNCTMLICCIFASLVRSNFNFSMVASFVLYIWSDLIAIFPQLFLALVYCHLFYFKIFLNESLFFKKILKCFQTCFFF